MHWLVQYRYVEVMHGGEECAPVEVKKDEFTFVISLLRESPYFYNVQIKFKGDVVALGDHVRP